MTVITFEQRLLNTPGISYPGFADSADRVREVHGRKTQLIDLHAKDLISITSVHGGESAFIVAVDEKGNSSGALLGIADQDHALDAEAILKNVDASEFDNWVGRTNISTADLAFCRLFASDTEAGTTITLQAQTRCEVWILVPVMPEFVSEGGGNTVSIKWAPRIDDDQASLPTALAKVDREFTVPRATATAYEVKRGEYIQIIDVEGRQCSDFIAFSKAALEQGKERFIDSTTTRSMVGSAYPQPGLFDKFYDQDMQPLLAVVQDTVGRHDTFALACTARGYETRGFPGHINCSDNISHAVKPYGVQARPAWPAVNLFFNTWITPHDNHLQSDEAWSRPGDYVVMQALTDLLCVSTACPDDIDPINGWNPTDIHVRVYSANANIPKSVAHRPYPESDSIMTENSAFHSRTAELAKSFQVARDLWLPSSYDASGAIEEYWACREKVTVQDMSSLRKFDVMGPDAERLLQLCLSKNVAKLSVNRGLYALMLADTGAVMDDGTLFRLAPELFRWCCGSDQSGKQLRKIAEENQLKVWVKSIWSAMPNLAVQGPKSRDLLSKILFTDEHHPDLANVKWFGFTIGRLFDREGATMMVTRTGFTGELGYEIFCHHNNATEIWDAIMQAGEEFGIMPMGSDALAMIRIEAGLMIAGAEFTPDVDALEAGLDFAIDLDKSEFVGLPAILRNKTAQRRKLVGLHLMSGEVPVHGDPIYVGQQQIGVVTSATYSPMLEKPIAMARVAIEHCEQGSVLEIGKLDGQMKRLSAHVVSIPFFDPRRERARV